MKHPEFEDLINNPDKDQLYVFYRSWKSLLPGILAFFLSLFIVIWIQVSYDMDDSPTACRLLTLIPLLILAETLRRYYNDVYIIGDDTIKRRHGRLSLHYHIPTIKYIDIRGILVTQSIWGRLLGYGDIEVGTSAQDGAELTIQKVDAPHEIYRLVESFKTFNLKTMSPLAKKHIND